MDKRLLRLITLAQIRQQLPAFTGKKINIVCTDDTVWFVKLLSVSENELAVQNMRLHKQSIPFSSVSEIIIDLSR